MLDHLKASPLLRPVRFLQRLWRGERPILIDYPPVPAARYGYSVPPIAAIADLFRRGTDGYRALLAGFLRHSDRLASIPLRPPEDGTEPGWVNGYLPGLDAAALYGLLARQAPRRYVEIGSGNSTKFARRAVRDHGLSTEIVSIDPSPRASVAALADRRIERPLEALHVEEFDALVGAGDFLFFDGSHRCFTNSDVTVFFLEILPRLKPGVWVQVHDVTLPWDYPPEWSGRWYSEQYVLAAYLLGGGGGTQVVLPNAYVSRDPELSKILDPVWSRPGLEDVERGGSSLWLVTGAATPGTSP
jgi:hypothetical protein